jgi:hypothetical protein
LGPILQEHKTRIEWNLQQLQSETSTPENEKKKAELLKEHQDIVAMQGLSDADRALARLIDDSIRQMFAKQIRDLEALSLQFNQ